MGINKVRKVIAIPLGIFAALAIVGLVVACSGLSSQTFSKYGISFEVSDQLILEEHTFVPGSQIFRRGPSEFDQGVVISSEKNFMLAWVYEPAFTPQLARMQVLNGPGFYESTNTSFSARLLDAPQTTRISDFEVTFALMEVVFNPQARGKGVIGVWYCRTSERAVIFLALHNDPTKELKRLVNSFSCS